MKKKPVQHKKPVIDQESETTVKTRTPPLRRVGELVLIVVCVIASFLLGNFVGGKLADAGVKEKFLAWREKTFTKKSEPVKKTPNPNAQTLTVGDVTIVSPGNNASMEEQQAFVDAIKKNAVEAKTVTISSQCALDPKVILVPSGTTVTFTNTDGSAHLLKIGATKKDISVEANASGEFTAESTMEGIHGIVCDSANTFVGFLQVTTQSK